MDLERLKDLVNVIGKQRLVLDLSCRKKVWNDNIRVISELGICITYSTTDILTLWHTCGIFVVT